MNRPDKLPAPAQLIVFASLELTAGEKLAWYNHWLIDSGGPDGCYMRPRTMAIRLGATARAVENWRTRLGTLGLLVKWRRAEGTEPFGWRAALPAVQVIPRAFKEAAEVAADLAAILDQHIRALTAGPALLPGHHPSIEGGVAPLVTGAAAGGVAVKGGRGVAPSSVVQPERQLVSPSRFEEGSEEGMLASEQTDEERDEIRRHLRERFA